MKQFLLIIVLNATAMTCLSQNSWKIRLNDITLISAAKEDEKAHVKRIDKALLSGEGYFEVIHTNASKDKNMIRSIVFVDDADNELLRLDSVSRVKIPVRQLKSLFSENKRVRVFTMSLPSDPAKAAAVRVRRVHLCSLELI
jgi:hypothetical protein